MTAQNLIETDYDSELKKLEAAQNVIANSILHGERCKCLIPFLICPPTGYCYNCDKLRSIDQPQAIYILDSFNHKNLEKQLIIKYTTLFPKSTRKVAAAALGWSERTFIRKLKQYGLLTYRPLGKQKRNI